MTRKSDLQYFYSCIMHLLTENEVFDYAYISAWLDSCSKRIFIFFDTFSLTYCTNLSMITYLFECTLHNIYENAAIDARISVNNNIHNINYIFSLSSAAAIDIDHFFSKLYGINNNYYLMCLLLDRVLSRV